MPQLVPLVHPLAHPRPDTGHRVLVLVPVPGTVVLGVCVLLICANLIWLGLLLHQGIEKDKEG